MLVRTVISWCVSISGCGKMPVLPGLRLEAVLK